MTEQVINPWYREPWPWFILGILGLGVFFGISILLIGLANPPQMVRGEYERLGRGMTDLGQRTEQARSMGLRGQLSWTEQNWRLDLVSNPGQSLPDQLLLIIQHPLNSELDRTSLLERQPDGSWSGQAVLPPHHATLILQDLAQNWWITARVENAEQRATELLPRRL